MFSGSWRHCQNALAGHPVDGCAFSQCLAAVQFIFLDDGIGDDVSCGDAGGLADGVSDFAGYQLVRHCDFAGDAGLAAVADASVVSNHAVHDLRWHAVAFRSDVRWFLCIIAVNACVRVLWNCGSVSVCKRA